MFNTLTTTAEEQPSIAASAGLNYKLFTVSTGWTVTGIDLDLQITQPVSASEAGITPGVFPQPDQLVVAIGYGTSGYAAPPITTHPDDSTIIWLGHPLVDAFIQFVPVSPNSSSYAGRAYHVELRTQWRMKANKDFYLQFGNFATTAASVNLWYLARMHYE